MKLLWAQSSLIGYNQMFVFNVMEEGTYGYCEQKKSKQIIDLPLMRKYVAFVSCTQINLKILNVFFYLITIHWII